MKVILLNTSDRTGGAAVAANRLLKALQKKGIITNMLVRDKVTQDTSVISINTSVVKKLINRIRLYGNDWSYSFVIIYLKKICFRYLLRIPGLIYVIMH